MNAVIQSSAHPLVVLERNTLITHALLDLLSAYTGSIFRVRDLHRCKIALSAQRLTPVLFLAGKPLESRWADWKAQVKWATHASCPVTAIDLSKGSAAPAFLKSQIIEDIVDLDDPSVDVAHHIERLLQQTAITTLAYGPLQIDQSRKTLSSAGRSVAIKDALFTLMALFWGHPQCVLSLKLLQKTLAEAETTSAIDARMAVSALRSRLRFLGFDDCIVTLRGRGYQFNPPDTFGHNTSFTDFSSSARRFGAAFF
jgi:DNA-binding winged helix-turn-helix (wHTH) protein